MRNNLFIIAIFLLSFNSYAQKYELGKVTIEELKQSRHPKDSSASAAILFEKGKSYFDYKQGDGFRLITEVEVRIKIYKKDGYDWANKEVLFYIGGTEKERVEFSKAITYNLVNGVIEKTKLKTEGEFTETVNKYWGKRKITMPNIKEGTIIEYKYSIKTPYYTTMPEWNFQTSIPVNHSEYSTYIPEYFIYNSHRKGFVYPKEIVSKNHKTITFNYTERTLGKISERSSEDVNYVESQTIYTLDDIPAIKEESYVNNIENYVASVQYEMSGRKMPNSLYESFAYTWSDVVKTIYENEDFGNELRKNNYFENDLKAILQGLETDVDKIATIFQYVKSRMNWNDFNGYSCDDGVKKAYETKTGNVAEINLMLTAMLRFAGINANPVLISTRSNGINIFPSRTAFNYVVAAVEIENGLILLDATSKNAYPNIMPIRTLNWFGRIIRKDGSSAEVDLMPKTNSKDIINLIATIDNEGSIDGKIKEQHFDYNAFSFREKYGSLSKENYLEKLEKKHNNIEIGEYETANNKDLDKPVIETYSFKKSNAVEIIGNKMYFSPLLFFTTSENPFKQEKREYPVDFVFPRQDKYLINITIPNGYVVETLPTPIAIAMDENLGNFKFNITNTEKQIQLLVTLDINSAIFSAEYYEELKAFFAGMIKKQSEKIVLKKV